MKTKEPIIDTFEALEQGLKDNNAAAMQAMAEQENVLATMTPTGVNTLVTIDPVDDLLKPRRRYRKSDAGIAQNVSNGEALVAVLESFEAEYNPSRDAIKVVNLKEMNIKGYGQIETVTERRQLRKDSINARQEIYVDIKPLGHRMRNELIASGASKRAVRDATHYVKLLDGVRIIPKKADATDKNYISASHTTFSQQVQNLTGFISLVSGVREYNPNIVPLQVASLVSKREAMIRTNKEASENDAYWSTSLVNRNTFFNADADGYVDTFNSVKRAVKAIFGGKSAQFRQVSKFKFIRVRG